jgi:hypothetical protein
MLLEDVSSSRKYSSVDFGKAAQDAAANPKGLGLPPPTEFIQSPELILDADAALRDARREKESLIWRARLQLRRVSEIARELAIKTWELLPKKADEPAVEVSKDIDLEEDDQADTARMPTPVPFPINRKTSQWEVTTQVVDMTKRRKASGTRKSSQVPVEDLTLDEPKK